MQTSDKEYVIDLFISLIIWGAASMNKSCNCFLDLCTKGLWWYVGSAMLQVCIEAERHVASPVKLWLTCIEFVSLGSGFFGPFNSSPCSAL